MNPLPSEYVSIFEAVNRNVRIGTNGTEIATTFYIEPATAAPIAVTALLGYVSVPQTPSTFPTFTNGSWQGGNIVAESAYMREPPVWDHEFPYCYCVEAHPRPFDQKSITSCATLMSASNMTGVAYTDIRNAAKKPINFNGPQGLADDGMSNTNVLPPERAMCGAYIEAIYRPLSSIYNMPGSYPSYTGRPTKPDYVRRFDYVDPQFHPCSRMFPFGGAANLYFGGYPFPEANSSAQLTESWLEFTIRRVMCPSVPYQTIAQLTGRINGLKAWTPANMTVPGLPNNTFPQGTLRFDGADIFPHYAIVLLPRGSKQSSLSAGQHSNDTRHALVGYPADIQLPHDVGPLLLWILGGAWSDQCFAGSIWQRLSDPHCYASDVECRMVELSRNKPSWRSC